MSAFFEVTPYMSGRLARRARLEKVAENWQNSEYGQYILNNVKGFNPYQIIKDLSNDDLRITEAQIAEFEKQIGQLVKQNIVIIKAILKDFDDSETIFQNIMTGYLKNEDFLAQYVDNPELLNSLHLVKDQLNQVNHVIHNLNLLNRDDFYNKMPKDERDGVKKELGDYLNATTNLAFIEESGVTDVETIKEESTKTVSSFKKDYCWDTNLRNEVIADTKSGRTTSRMLLVGAAFIAACNIASFALNIATGNVPVAAINAVVILACLVNIAVFVGVHSLENKKIAHHEQIINDTNNKIENSESIVIPSSSPYGSF